MITTGFILPFFSVSSTSTTTTPTITATTHTTTTATAATTTKMVTTTTTMMTTTNTGTTTTSPKSDGKSITVSQFSIIPNELIHNSHVFNMVFL